MPRTIRKVRGVAYSGGPLRQWWSGDPVVIDLSTLRAAPQIPILNAHRNDITCRLGLASPKVDNGRLIFDGDLDADSCHGATADILAAGEQQPWQISVGVHEADYTSVPEGNSVIVNGQTFRGPLLVATNGILREISVVAVGADAHATMDVVLPPKK